MLDTAPDCYVMSSKLHGVGLYAGKNFEKDEILLDMSPYKKEFYKIRYDKLNDYQISRNWHINIDQENCLTFDRFSKFGYVNHSRTPNANWLINKYIIVANRYIKSNEEITIDYRTEIRPNRQEFPNWI